MAGTGKKVNTTKATSVDAMREHVADLLARGGERTRVVLKYRHCDSKASLRVTDDWKTVKYTTNRQIDVSKITRLLGLAVQGKATDTAEGSLRPSASPTRARKGKGKQKAKKG